MNSYNVISNHKMKNLTQILRKMEEEPEFSELEIQEFIRCVNKDILYKKNYNIYGPANPMKKNQCDDEDLYICRFTPTGICHMMTCKCLEENGDYIKDNDWFTGFCCLCDKKIVKRKDAWRIPHKNGGFIGCYCSDEHMEDQFIAEEDEEYTAIIKVMKAVRLKFPIFDIDFGLFDGITDEVKDNFNI